MSVMGQGIFAAAWLHIVSWFFLALGLACAAIAMVSVIRSPLPMKIMNVVWPTTALFGGPLTLWLFYRYARGAGSKNEANAPYPIMVAKGALHCGSGCMIGDILAEWLAFLVPAVAIWAGWHSLFSLKMYAVWVLDFCFAFALGIVFQYFAIVPMRKLSFFPGLVAALKADALSLIAWQIGMYGFMAFAQFFLLKNVLGHRAEVDTPEFWFVMQIAMIAGFATAYPVNWWLLSSGVKEKM